MQTLADRGLIEEAGRSQFGAAIFKTSELFERLFGLSGLDQLPDPSQFDPSPEDERELRERLLKAGEQRRRVAVRLAKYLAHGGVASRRRAEEIIAKGVVTVGGRGGDRSGAGRRRRATTCGSTAARSGPRRPRSGR